MDKIFDPLRNISVARTPEEEVRQSVVSWLNMEKGIPMHMMMSEPLMLVECKAPSVSLGRDVLEQGVRYNRVLNVKYMLFTNGRSMYFCERVGDGPEYRFLPEIPDIKI